MTLRHAALVVFLASVLAVTACKTTSSSRPSEPSSPLPHEVRDETGGYAAAMPTEPSIERESYETTHGPIREVTYESKTARAVYMLTFSEFPPEALEALCPDEHLEGARDGSLRSTGGDLIDERKIALGEALGLEMTVQVDGGYYRTRVFVSGSRMLQILVASADDEVFSELSTTFLDSLVIDDAGDP